MENKVCFRDQPPSPNENVDCTVMFVMLVLHTSAHQSVRIRGYDRNQFGQGSER